VGEHESANRKSAGNQARRPVPPNQNAAGFRKILIAPRSTAAATNTCPACTSILRPTQLNFQQEAVPPGGGSWSPRQQRRRGVGCCCYGSCYQIGRRAMPALRWLRQAGVGGHLKRVRETLPAWKQLGAYVSCAGGHWKRLEAAAGID